MKDTTTYKTARKLADAGFPQPAPAPGQWWGDESGSVFVFRAWIDEGHSYFIVAQTVSGGRPIIDDYFDARDFRGLVYLPTVGDILKELGFWFELLFGGNQTWLICQTKSLSDYPEVVAEHKTSAAEAAALAYLDTHEKPIASIDNLP